MRCFIERAQSIATRKQRLEQIIKSLLSDQLFCRILFEERTELLPAILARRLSASVTGYTPPQSRLTNCAWSTIGAASQAPERRSLLRRVSARRQEEIAEIMTLSADRSLSFLRLLVLVSKEPDFIRGKETPRGVQPHEMKLIEREIASLEEAFRTATAAYANDAYVLALIEAYLRSLVKNARIAAYLRSVWPRLFAKINCFPAPGILLPSSNP